MMPICYTDIVLNVLRQTYYYVIFLLSFLHKCIIALLQLAIL